MKHKVSELSGALLDAAVAMADGRPFRIEAFHVSSADCGVVFIRAEPVCVADNGHFEPSLVWAIGGPIIERERIAVSHGSLMNPNFVEWHAVKQPVANNVLTIRGPTCLVAAMRCYVISKLGEEIELP